LKKIATFWQLLDTFIGNFFGIYRQLVAKPTVDNPLLTVVCHNYLHHFLPYG